MSDIPSSDPAYSATRSHEVVVDEEVYPRISWRAVIAGVVVLMSLSWLMHLLGGATGLSVADATDSATLEGGLPVASSIWMIVSWLIAFFVGGLVAARLAGNISDMSGMLHGLTVWGTATVLMVAMAFSGMTYLLETGYSVVGSAVGGVGAVASEAGGALASTEASNSNNWQQGLNSQFATTLQERLIDSAAEAGASIAAPLTVQSVRQEINGLDERTLRRIASDLNADDTEGAAEYLENATSLSSEAAVSVMQATQQALQQTEQPSEGDAQLLRTQLLEQAEAYVQNSPSTGQQSVSPQELRRAMLQLDQDALQRVALAVIAGDEQRAKRTLARHTDLTTEQIEQVYQGAQQGIEEELQSYQETFEETVATVADYTQAFLWAAFACTAMSMLASLGGGWLGADATRRVVTTHRRNVRTTV